MNNKTQMYIRYTFPVLVLLLVMVLFFNWLIVRNETKDTVCEPYRNKLVKDLPAKCYSYFKIN